MYWSDIKNISEPLFVRATGVNYNIFNTMVECVKTELSTRKYPGRPPTLIVEDQILLTLMYYREYRTLFMIGQTYQISESTTSKTISRIEEILIKYPQFNLLKCGKLKDTQPTLSKENLENTSENKSEVIDNQSEWYIIDASEFQIERHKVDQASYYSGKKKAYNESSVYY